MKILAIETSCDETAICLVEHKENNTKTIGDISILGNSVSSQANLHAEFGGVFPSLAKREHAKNIVPVLLDTLNQSGVITANKIKLNDEQLEFLKEIFKHEPELFEIFISHIPQISQNDIDYICVTTGPGLAPALWVGVNFAKALSFVFDIPVLQINHMEGHVVSPLLTNNAEFPAISLLISGGHTELIYTDKIGSYNKIGQTLDDAVGEAYDKTARLLGLTYPGGPKISLLAQKYRELNNYNKISTISLPRPMINSKDLNFSFSGLKTSVLYLIRNLEKNDALNEDMKILISAEFEQAVTDVLISKLIFAIKNNPVKTVLVGGGVSANVYIKENIQKAVFEFDNQIKILFPEKDLSTDNAVMIAMAGITKILDNDFDKKENGLGDIVAQANWEL